MSEKQYLNDVYKISGTEQTRSFYDDWAECYDRDVIAKGYMTPTRIATTLATHVADKAAAILDVGCGTGLCGLALSKAGFTTIDGTDLSTGMLDKARATQAYRTLWLGDANEPLDVTPGRYRALTASGVISKGAAPPQMFDTLAAVMSPGTLLVFSYNGHTLEDAAYMRKLDEMITGPFALCSEENGPHLPDFDLTSTIYVLERQS